MNGMFENRRGLKDLAKHLHVAESIREHVLDFVATPRRANGIIQQVF
jgi:hypothetical protein